MLNNVTGNIATLLVVGPSVCLVSVFLIIGLKLKWFRARMTFDHTTSVQEVPYVGVYRRTPIDDFDSFQPYTTPTPVPSQLNNTYQAQANDGEKLKQVKKEKTIVPKMKDIKTKPPKEDGSRPINSTPPPPPFPLQLPSGSGRPKPPKVKSTRSTEEATTKAPKKKDKESGKNKHKEMGKNKVREMEKNKDLEMGKNKNKSAKNKNKEMDKKKPEAQSKQKGQAEKRPDQGDNILAWAESETPGDRQSQGATSTRPGVGRGQNHTMSSFALGPTTTAPPPPPRSFNTRTATTFRNPIAMGAQSYHAPREQGSHSARINVTPQMFGFGNMEEESET